MEYLNVTADKLNAFIFERIKPYQDNDVIKDGIHMVYPFIVCDTYVQHLIREEVLKNCESILKSLGCQNGYEDIIDKGVIDNQIG